MYEEHEAGKQTTATTRRERENLNMESAPTDNDSETTCTSTGDLLAWSDRRRANGRRRGWRLVLLVHACQAHARQRRERNGRQGDVVRTGSGTGAETPVSDAARAVRAKRYSDGVDDAAMLTGREVMKAMASTRQGGGRDSGDSGDGKERKGDDELGELETVKVGETTYTSRPPSS
ncbi:hypothetical protein C8Q74DRAFT_1215757 [Fomes fomentarius]|nr:hypothetical protein C8Q74DRAFT_1215757 [Fomes fomentarius]